MTPEQAALVQKARDSLRGARVLAQDGLPDFAAGRAYYTMFYLAQALLLEQGLTFSKHASTISAFGLQVPACIYLRLWPRLKLHRLKNS